jgi:hypothetical protein
MRGVVRRDVDGSVICDLREVDWSVAEHVIEMSPEQVMDMIFAEEYDDLIHALNQFVCNYTDERFEVHRINGHSPIHFRLSARLGLQSSETYDLEGEMEELLLLLFHYV